MRSRMSPKRRPAAAAFRQQRVHRHTRQGIDLQDDRSRRTQDHERTLVGPRRFGRHQGLLGGIERCEARHHRLSRKRPARAAGAIGPRARSLPLGQRVWRVGRPSDVAPDAPGHTNRPAKRRLLHLRSPPQNHGPAGPCDPVSQRRRPRRCRGLHARLGRDRCHRRSVHRR